MNISFSKLGKHGRLGNQLFQITSTMGIAEKYGGQAIFPDWEYERYFENYLTRGPAQAKVVEERRFEYYDWEIVENCDLFGYMQTEKYFGDFGLRFKWGFLEQVKKSMPMKYSKTIALHFRRGDYVNNPNYFYIPINWYIGALEEEFPDWRNCNLLIFSNPEDMGGCKIHFSFLENAYFSEGRSDIEDLALMSTCDGFVISNSSF